MRKLQLTLKDFRRICILKGIYPREPMHVKKANKGSTENKIYYHLRDIKFLAREPILDQFKNYKIFLRKLTNAQAKKDEHRIKRLLDDKPEVRLDHIVKERYPSFLSALQDLDDGLSLCFAFSVLTRSKVVRPALIDKCRKLSIEFLHYVIEAKALRKVFVSIKGIYYQAEIMGECITWVVGHERSVGHINEMDFSVMVDFVDFYTTVLSFVNFRLYKDLGLHYPPQLQLDGPKDDEYFSNDLDSTEYRISLLGTPLKRECKEETETGDLDLDLFEEGKGDGISNKLRELQQLRNLFSAHRIFLNREIPKEPLTLIIRSCGGVVSWDGLPNSFPESNEYITHQIVDRTVNITNVNRTFVQPQWIFDSFNARKLLPTMRYAPNAKLPPHISPFVEEDVIALAEYKVKQDCQKEPVKQIEHEGKIQNRKRQANDSRLVDKISVRPAKAFKQNIQMMINEEGHNLKLREMMIPKRHKRVYDKIKFGIKKKEKAVKKLSNRRKQLETTDL